jgi:hypothetical protein
MLARMMRSSPSLFIALFFLAACGSTPKAGDVANAANAAEGGADMKAAAKAQLESLASAATAFETANGRCPTSVDEVSSPPPNDPWGSPIAFMPKGPENPQSAFVSSGPDKELLTADDIAVPVTCMGG